MKENIAVYRTNDDAVITLAQAGDYIREHAGDLIGTVIGDGLATHSITVRIVMEPMRAVRIVTTKENFVKTVIPFADDED